LKSILTDLHLDPNSPAFSHLEMRQTFFEEVLLVPKPERQVELLGRWHIPFDQFLDFAVSHELGHALCTEENEQQADRVARLLEQKRPVAPPTRNVNHDKTLGRSQECRMQQSCFLTMTL